MPLNPIPTTYEGTAYQLPPRSQWQWSQLHQHCRGDGTTTKQIKEAPRGSFFITANTPMSRYCRRIAINLCRQDIRFFERSQILGLWFQGQNIPGIVVDHDVALSYEELVVLCSLRIRPI